MLKCKLVPDIVMLNVCVKLCQNRSIKRSESDDKVFSKNSSSDLDLDSKILDQKLVQDIVKLNVYVKLYQNLSINTG